MNRSVAVSYNSLSDSSDTTDDYDDTPDGQMLKGLLMASQKPARPNQITSFRKLHSPRVHKMAEWLLQYESVCRREQQYLQQIKELRQQFQSHDNNRLNAHRHMDSSKSYFFWRPSQAPFAKLGDNISNAACFLRPPPKHTINLTLPASDVSVQETTEFIMAPTSVNASIYSKEHVRQPYKLPQIVGIDRNKTDYEPIENIAKRNKLNFNKYF